MIWQKIAAFVVQWKGCLYKKKRFARIGVLPPPFVECNNMEEQEHTAQNGDLHRKKENSYLEESVGYKIFRVRLSIGITRNEIQHN